MPPLNQPSVAGPVGPALPIQAPTGAPTPAGALAQVPGTTGQAPMGMPGSPTMQNPGYGIPGGMHA